MIRYRLSEQSSRNPLWWQSFVKSIFFNANELQIMSLLEHDGYVNEVLAEKYSAVYCSPVRSDSPGYVEFRTDEGHMLFMLEWA